MPVLASFMPVLCSVMPIFSQRIAHNEAHFSQRMAHNETSFSHTRVYVSFSHTRVYASFSHTRVCTRLCTTGYIPRRVYGTYAPWRVYGTYAPWRVYTSLYTPTCTTLGIPHSHPAPRYRTDLLVHGVEKRPWAQDGGNPWVGEAYAPQGPKGVTDSMLSARRCSPLSSEERIKIG